MKNCKHGRTIDKCSTCIIDDLAKSVESLTKKLAWSDKNLQEAWDGLYIWKEAAKVAEATLKDLLEQRDKVIVALQDLDIPKQPHIKRFE